MTNSDGNPKIYLMFKNGKRQMNLTRNSALDLGVQWSHDRTQLAFVSNRDGGKDIFLMKPETGELQKLTTRGDVLMSPYGRRTAAQRIRLNLHMESKHGSVIRASK